jgi:ribosome-interacting GTPase 1
MQPKYRELIDGDFVGISADRGEGIDKLIDEIWKALKFVTVYLVKPDENLEKGKPIVMREGETLKDVALKIGPDFAESKKIVKIWGVGAKFPGQEVSFETLVLENMKIRFIA